MDLYFFNLHECGSLYADEEGRELESVDVASVEAIAAARSVMSHEVAAGRLCLSCRIEVKDSAGRVVLTIPFREALTVTGG